MKLNKLRILNFTKICKIKNLLKKYPNSIFYTGMPYGNYLLQPLKNSVVSIHTLKQNLPGDQFLPDDQFNFKLVERR